MSIFSKVSVCTDTGSYDKIAMDFIGNRFDLTGVKDFVLLKWQKRDEEYYVQAAFEDDKASLGIWLAPISKEILNDISRFIFRHYRKVRIVEYRFGLIPFAKSFPVNHFRIELPDSVEALHARMSQKSRYNLRRSRRMLEEAYSPVCFEEYMSENVPLRLIDDYLERKKLSHDFEFSGPPEDYLRSHGVTDVYVIKNSDAVISILLSCEQCRVVFLENLTYNNEFSRFSPGQILYEHYLERLIEKNRTMLFLMGGDYEYKRRYGSIEDTVYFGYIYKGLRANWKNIYRKKLKKLYKTYRHRVKLLLTGLFGKSGNDAPS